jgi:hypothetical protein
MLSGSVTTADTALSPLKNTRMHAYDGRVQAETHPPLDQRVLGHAGSVGVQVVTTVSPA